MCYDVGLAQSQDWLHTKVEQEGPFNKVPDLTCTGIRPKFRPRTAQPGLCIPAA